MLGAASECGHPWGDLVGQAGDRIEALKAVIAIELGAGAELVRHRDGREVEPAAHLACERDDFGVSPG